ncbi:hypothetical protein Tco_0792562 [Tanacetum coccineum]
MWVLFGKGLCEEEFRLEEGFKDEIYEGDDEGLRKGMFRVYRGYNHLLGKKGKQMIRKGSMSGFMMDDPNITMEKYIKLQAEKAKRYGRMFNWETATYVRAQRHPWLRYEVDGYTEEVVQEFKHRLARIFSRRVHWVQVLVFEGMTEEMGMDIVARLSMRHRDVEGLVVFTSHAWRSLFDIRGPLVRELMLEFFNTCRFDDLVLDLDTDGVLSFQLDGFRRYWAESSRTIASKGDLRAGRGQAPEKVTSTDLYFLRSMDQEAMNLPYLLAHYLFRHAKGRKRGAQMSSGYFIVRLTDHFGLLMEESLRGTTVVVRELERQQVATDDALRVVTAEAPHAEEEGGHAVPAPVQAPQPPSAASTMPQRLYRLEDEVHVIQVDLGKHREVVDAMAKDLSRFTMWTTRGAGLDRGLERPALRQPHLTRTNQTPDLFPLLF